MKLVTLKWNKQNKNDWMVKKKPRYTYFVKQKDCQNECNR